MNTNAALSWDLLFFDRKLESSYRETKFNYQRPLLKVLMLFELVSGCHTWIANPFNLPLFKSIVFVALILVSMSALLAVLKWKPQYSEGMLVIFVLLESLVLLEIANPAKSEWSHVTYFLTGVKAQQGILILIIARVCIKMTVFVLLGISTACVLRYSNFEDNIGMRFYPLTQLLIFTITLVVITYVVLKQDRKNFLDLKTSESSLSCYRDIIKEVFPNAILISAQSQILFRNNEAEKMFETEESEKILEGFKKLKLCSWDDRNKCFNVSSALLNPRPKKSDCIRHRPLDDKPEERSKSLYDFLLEAHGQGEPAHGKNIENLYSFYALLEKEGTAGPLEFFEINVKNIIWEKQQALMVILSENQTIQRLRALNEQTNYKDRLLATVSHDLRTPLNGLIGMVTSAKELTEDRTQQKMLGRALRSANLLLFMINDFLDHSLITNGKLRLSFQYFSLWALIKDISKLFKFQSKQKGINLILENRLAPEVSDSLRSDPNRIKQVLLNLLGNALKFTSKGFIKVSLELDPGFPGEPGFLIKVEDTGIGIKKEDQSGLFTLFGRIKGKSSERTNPNGIGLGLAISQTLVTVLNNDNEDTKIRVASEYGRGSCFFFTLLPNKHDESSASPTEQEETPRMPNSLLLDKFCSDMIREQARSPQARKPLHILIVDDDQINILVTTSFLRDKSKYNCHVASNGLEAINMVASKALENFFFDVILMDCNMPVMNGFEATEILRGLISRNEIPIAAIIACTASASAEDNNTCLRMGMTDFISKPYSGEVLRRKIAKHAAGPILT